LPTKCAIFYHCSAAMPQIPKSRYAGENHFVIEQKQDSYRTSFQQHPKIRDDFFIKNHILFIFSSNFSFYHKTCPPIQVYE